MGLVLEKPIQKIKLMEYIWLTALDHPHLSGRKKPRAYADHAQQFEEHAEANHGHLPAGEHEKIVRNAIAMGLSRMDVPKSHGGLELSLLEQAVVWEQLGRVTNTCTWGFSEPQQWMFRHCTSGQIEKWIKPMMTGEKREAFALTEAESGSSADSIKATARREGDHYILNGEKWFVTGFNRANFLFFEAVVEEDPDRGHGLFFVEAQSQGIEIKETPEFSHTLPLIHPILTFRDVRVEKENLIGKAGDALDYTRSWFRRERVMISARCCGAAARLIDEGLEFSKNRKVDGEPIFEFQLIQAMLADSLTELWGAKLMTYEAAAASDRGESPSVVHSLASMAKLYSTEMAGRVADRVLQIFGGRGYMRKNPAERFMRELRVERIWEGTSEIQRLIIARSLVKRGVKNLIGE